MNRVPFVMNQAPLPKSLLNQGPPPAESENTPPPPRLKWAAEEPGRECKGDVFLKLTHYYDVGMSCLRMIRFDLPCIN